MIRINRQQLQELSRVRRREAASLLKARHYPGAYYLLGYSVECALKACIAKQAKKYEFPNKEFAIGVYTHNLQKLLELASLERELAKDMKANRVLALNWAVVKDWNEHFRYSSFISSADARDFYSACTSRKNGLLSWIRARW